MRTIRVSLARHELGAAVLALAAGVGEEERRLLLGALNLCHIVGLGCLALPGCVVFDGADGA
eukprot:scaffold518_cov388-Prasinococcus_capsulatus_cf.AAC.59